MLRFGTIVGDDRQTRYWLRAAASGRSVGIGHPSDWAHVIHTDDLGGAVLASLHAPSGVYNVGAEPVQRHDLVQGYADAAGVESGALHRLLVGRWLIGPRLEPLSRSLRVSSRPLRRADRLARELRPKFDAGWLEEAVERASRCTRDPVNREAADPGGTRASSPTAGRRLRRRTPGADQRRRRRAGDEPEGSDEWLRRQVPPHHG